MEWAHRIANVSLIDPAKLSQAAHEGRYTNHGTQPRDSRSLGDKIAMLHEAAAPLKAGERIVDKIKTEAARHKIVWMILAVTLLMAVCTCGGGGGGAGGGSGTDGGGSANNRPLADAGIDQTVVIGNMVTLDGRGSSDPDGDPLTYQWQFVALPEGSGAELSDADSVWANFVPDLLDSYEVELVVSDGKESSEPDDVAFTAENPPDKQALGDAVAEAQELLGNDPANAARLKWNYDQELVSRAGILWRSARLTIGTIPAPPIQRLLDANVATSIELMQTVENDWANRADYGYTVDLRNKIRNATIDGLVYLHVDRTEYRQ